MSRIEARMGAKRKAYKVLVRKPKGKRPLGRPRHRWEGNIKLDLTEIGWDGMDWIDLVQSRDRWKVVNRAINL
jgi:hypothetical protein